MNDRARQVGATSSEDLFAGLSELERRCRRFAVGLPQREKPPEIWAGILFHVGQIPLLAELEEIAEVLELPRDLTPVPATRSWVRGVANNRGTLLPIFDLRGLLFDTLTARSPKSRVLVARGAEVPFGLFVSDVTGIRRFNADAERRDVPDLDGAIKALVVGSFRLGGEVCPVFSLRRMAEDARFSLAAA